MKYIIIVLILPLILTGCSDGYPEFGNGYKVSGQGGYLTTVIDSSNRVIIPFYILDYVVDSNFILIAQSPIDSLPKMNTFYYSDSYRKEIAANKNVFRQYWIINKLEAGIYSYDSINQSSKYSNIYGPFNENEYKTQRINLDIPSQLKLNRE